MKVNFSSGKTSVLHLDINSCFATIEQQANYNLRGKAVVVAAYTTSGGCILASSIEAKRLGIKTGMRVGEGKVVYPKLIVLPPDPAKYRYIHKKLKRLLEKYSCDVFPKSIDEFVLKVAEGNPCKIALEIKKQIKKKVGDYIRVSIGISTNRYLAKVASNLKKPDGLVEINKDNFLDVYSRLKLTDLKGIKKANERRLKRVGINTVVDFYNSPVWKLKIAFCGIFGYYWYLRLHGYEIDDFKSTRKTFGNSYAPPIKLAGRKLPILSKLCQKTGFRLRKAKLTAGGIHLGILFRDGSFWHKGLKTKRVIVNGCDIYEESLRLLKQTPSISLPRIIAISVFNLQSNRKLQRSFFTDEDKKNNLSDTMDAINLKWGEFTLYPARMAGCKEIVKDRISFGQL